MLHALPAWLLAPAGPDYAEERAFLDRLTDRAFQDGWRVTPGAEVAERERRRADLLLTKGDATIWLSVLPKRRGQVASLLVDLPDFRTLGLLYDRKTRRWRLDSGDEIILSDVDAAPWPVLVRALGFDE